MAPLRRLLAQRRLALLICMAGLLLKLVIPTGYMIASDGGRIAVTLCSGTAAGPMVMPAIHDHRGEHGKRKDYGKAEMPCAFAGLSAAALGAVDPILLAAAIAFLLAMGLSPVVLPAPFPPAYLRPPLRGPPALL